MGARLRKQDLNFRCLSKTSMFIFLSLMFVLSMSYSFSYLLRPNESQLNKSFKYKENMSIDEGLSTSSSTADLGISRETSSGINLCEIDSLENVFLSEEQNVRERSKANRSEDISKCHQVASPEPDTSPVEMHEEICVNETTGGTPIESASPHDPDSPGDKLCPHSPLIFNKDDPMKYWDSEHSLHSKEQIASNPPAALSPSFWSSFLTSGFSMSSPEPPKSENNNIKPTNEFHRETDDDIKANRASEFNIFESITPEPLSDYTDDEHVPSTQYPCIDAADQTAIKLNSEFNVNSSTDSGSTYQIIDTESQAAIFENISTEEKTEDEDLGETCSDCSESEDPLVAFDEIDIEIPVCGTFEAEDRSQCCFISDANELPIEKDASHEDVFVDAPNNLERKSSSHYWTCEEISNLVDLSNLEANLERVEVGTQSPSAEKNHEEYEDCTRACEKSPSCVSRVFEKVFQMHVAEDEGNPRKKQKRMSPEGTETSSSRAADLKDYEAIQSNLESMVDGDVLQVPDETRWMKNPNYVDSICVEIDVHSMEPRDAPVQKVGLKLPVHKADAKSAMIVVNNVHLRRTSVQFVQTPSEVSYQFSAGGITDGDGRYFVGQFHMRSVLAIPVAFKMTSVNHLELTPSIGIIQPRQKLLVQVYTSKSPQIIGFDRLRMEGILIYAAPFVFNRNRSVGNITLNDMNEFWSKFCTPRFRHAQTKFIPIQVYKPCVENTEDSCVSSITASSWSYLKCLNMFKVTPKLFRMNKCTHQVLKSKQISPLGHMILRRRQSLALEASRQADVLNDRRTMLTIAVIVLVTSWILFYFHVRKPELARRESALYRYQVSHSWWRNLLTMHSKVWLQGS